MTYIRATMERRLVILLSLFASFCGVSAFHSHFATSRRNYISLRNAGRVTCRVEPPSRRKEIDDDDEDNGPAPWPDRSARNKNYALATGEVAVRFINAPGRFPSTGQNDVSIPDGCDEMVVDLYRMLTGTGKAKPDPMARFEKMDDPNEGFKARWNLPDSSSSAKRDCSACGARGVDLKGMMPEDCSLGAGCPFRKK